MSPFPKTKTPSQRELDKLYSDLHSHPTESEEYATILDRIVKLSKLQAEESPQRVSPDTLILAGTNLLGIVLILKHEQLNVVTTKAMSLVLKPR